MDAKPVPVMMKRVLLTNFGDQAHRAGECLCPAEREDAAFDGLCSPGGTLHQHAQVLRCFWWNLPGVRAARLGGAMVHRDGSNGGIEGCCCCENVVVLKPVLLCRWAEKECSCSRPSMDASLPRLGSFLVCFFTDWCCPIRTWPGWAR